MRIVAKGRRAPGRRCGTTYAAGPPEDDSGLTGPQSRSDRRRCLAVPHDRVIVAKL